MRTNLQELRKSLESLETAADQNKSKLLQSYPETLEQKFSALHLKNRRKTHLCVLSTKMQRYIPWIFGNHFFKRCILI